MAFYPIPLPGQFKIRHLLPNFFLSGNNTASKFPVKSICGNKGPTGPESSSGVEVDPRRLEARYPTIRSPLSVFSIASSFHFTRNYYYQATQCLSLPCTDKVLTTLPDPLAEKYNGKSKKWKPNSQPSDNPHWCLGYQNKSLKRLTYSRSRGAC